MSLLIVTVIFGLFIAYFATQNALPVPVTLAENTLTIPLYFIVVGSLLVGLLLAWIISLTGSLSSFFTIHGKDKAIKEAKTEILELTKKVHELELENTRLKAISGESSVDDKSL